MNALLALRLCNRGRLLSVRPAPTLFDHLYASLHKAFGRSFQASVPCLLLPLHRIPPLPKTTINPKRKALKRIPVAKTGNGDSVLYIGFTLSIYQHRQQVQRFQVRDYPSSQAYIRRPKFRLFRRCRQASAYSCYRLPCRLRSTCRCLYGR